MGSRISCMVFSAPGAVWPDTWPVNISAQPSLVSWPLATRDTSPRSPDLRYIVRARSAHDRVGTRSLGHSLIDPFLLLLARIADQLSITFSEPPSVEKTKPFFDVVTFFQSHTLYVTLSLVEVTDIIEVELMQATSRKSSI